MAERKSQNKYYPPDWDPSKGSVNKYVGQHPLRDRAKKIAQGILVIRFEMPYNIWCGGCNSHIGMGVRYNAEKKKVGNYYSTPIWQFRMKCHLCDNYFEIQTDPQHHDYVIVSGARRKEQRWDPKDNEQIATEDKAIIKKMANDPMFKLEHTSDDVKKAANVQMTVGQLEDRRSEYRDDYILNKMARSQFREEKKALKKTAMEDKDLLERSSLDITLLPESKEDVKIASLLKYKSTETYDEKQKQLRKEIESQTIFQKSNQPKDGKETIKHKLATVNNNKHLGFNSCEAVTYRTLTESQRLLGIRKKNNLNKSKREHSRSSQETEEAGNSDVQIRLAPISEEVSSDSVMENQDLECEQSKDSVNKQMPSTSADMSGLNLVNSYQDSDSDSDSKVT
ncbi:coiled-coil domain-containing protein 130 homolog [Saccostrea echinata]|uniref:coiled-coil domain-containing protein 130 homolog n=1 Tax=Saccostrea echinata TaxID=191078 RepID=UPI002A8334DD|nr:coiled-coil domain-containing protein 130 homolog [Saccostrea echinata]